MRVLVVAEEAPDRSATGNGSTMIPANVVPLLAGHAGVEVDLAWFDSRRRALDEECAAACRRLIRLPMRSKRASLAAMAFTRLPRASWRRDTPESGSLIAGLVGAADAIWVHGLHAFPAVLDALEQVPGSPADSVVASSGTSPARSPVGPPVGATTAPAAPAWPAAPAVLAHEVDPWSAHWAQRAAADAGPRRRYYRAQARAALALEQRMARLARTYVVVAPADALALGASLGREVLAVPNGVTGIRGQISSVAVGEPSVEPVVGFLGSLDYPPNIDAVRRLVGTVMPLVMEQAPGARLEVAGRRAGPQVAAVAGGAARLVGEVDDPARFYRSVAVMAFPGDLGTGTKNTVSEALAAGAAVVASRHAARGMPEEGQLIVADDDEELADQVARLLLDPAGRAELGARAAEWAAGHLPNWDACAQALLAGLGGL